MHVLTEVGELVLIPLDYLDICDLSSISQHTSYARLMHYAIIETFTIHLILWAKSWHKSSTYA